MNSELFNSLCNFRERMYFIVDDQIGKKMCDDLSDKLWGNLYENLDMQMVQQMVEGIRNEIKS